MTSTEIAVRQNGQVPELAGRDVVDGWLAVASDVIKLANVIAETEFVPKEYRDSPPAVAAAILVGRELGIGPMMSLRHVQIVRGVPTLSAEYKRARVLAAGHDFEIEELNTTRCKVRGRRAGASKWLECTFTIDDAKRAKIYKADGAWTTRPRRMLFARAGSELCDFMFADVTNGLPTAELVADGTEGDGFAGYDEAPSQTSPSNGQPAPRTAQRRTRAKAEDPTPAPGAAGTAPTARRAPAAGGAANGSQTAAGHPATSSTPEGLPPLPGEDDDPAPSPQTSSPADPARSQQGTQQPSASSPDGSEPGDPQPPFDPDEHGTATRGKGGQLTALWTVLGTVYRFENTDPGRKQACGAVEKLISRKLDGGTTGDLSYNEARGVLDTLARVSAKADQEHADARELLIEFLVKIDETLGRFGEADGS